MRIKRMKRWAQSMAVESLETRRLLAINVNPLPTTGGIRMASTTTDAAGNVYMVGGFQGTTTFDKAGKIKLAAIGEFDAFIMRIDAATGATIVRRLVSTSVGQGEHTVVAPQKVIVKNGHVTVTGYFSGHVDMDPTKGVKAVDGHGATDSFVLDLAATTLNYNWSNTWGGAGDDDPNALARDSKGNTWVVGDFQGTATFAGTPVHQLTSGGSFDALIAKFGPTGKYLFSARIGAAGDEVLRDVAVDSHDNVFIGGQFQKTVDSNPGTATANLVTADGTTSAMLVELNSAGAFKASKAFVDNSFSTLTNVEIDSTDSLYLMGNFDGHFDADPGSKVTTLTTKGANDIWMSKLTSTFAFKWGFGFGSAGVDQGFDLFLDSKNQVLVTGMLVGNADLNPSSAKAILAGDTAGDGFVSAFSAAGKFQGAAQIGGTGPANPLAVTRTVSGYILATDFQDSINLTIKKIPSTTTPAAKLFSSPGITDTVLFLITPATLGST